MCMVSKPKTPKAPAAVPEAAQAPATPSQAGGDAATKDKRRRAAARSGGPQSTILTSARGAMEGSTSGKTLLGG